jgi:serine/threonine protein phosphatase PrpC
MAATITCPNPECNAPNQLSQSLCAHCRFPIPKIYLWAIGDELSSFKVGQTLNNRYLLVDKKILLDTKPAAKLDSSEKVTDEIAKYLRLLPSKLNIPQVYGSLTVARTGRRNTPIWLLENPPIYSSSLVKNLAGQLMPDIESAWKTAGSIRQLNWLWQIAQLWAPLMEEEVASTLLDPNLLRVDQGIVKILELSADVKPPKLTDLGYLWQKWLKNTRLGAAQSIEKICQGLIQGEITDTEQLIAALDQALAVSGQRQFLECEYVTLSHTGPSRNQNEDSCYPPSGEVPIHKTGYDLSLAIVCDGVGGHQGGEVASSSAIETIRNRLENVLNKPENRNPESIAGQITTSVCVANDQISLRNDNENRQERQRMGTTMAMTLIYGHEVYISNVGDSRIYRITRSSCQQITLDDDLATREVRLGYSLYREALDIPASGSLFQALGMNSSSNLRPTVQRLIVDEECIFLMCSDGLSDNNRVEQFWQSDILPILEGKIDLMSASHRLVNTANNLNGHDNVTVALLHCRVQQPREAGQVNNIENAGKAIDLSSPDTLMLPGPQSTTGQPLQKSQLLLGLLAALLGLGLAGALAWKVLGNRIDPVPSQSPTPTVSPTA